MKRKKYRNRKKKPQIIPKTKNIIHFANSIEMKKKLERESPMKRVTMCIRGIAKQALALQTKYNHDLFYLPNNINLLRLFYIYYIYTIKYNTNTIQYLI